MTVSNDSADDSTTRERDRHIGLLPGRQHDGGARAAPPRCAVRLRQVRSLRRRQQIRPCRQLNEFEAARIVGWRNAGIFGVITGLLGGTNTPKESYGSPTPPKGASVLASKSTGAVLLAVFLLGGFSLQAQTNAPPVAAPLPPPNFFNGFTQAGQAFVNFFVNDPATVTETNWVAIPFGSYDLDSQKIGGGLALVHPLTGMLYAGARFENINGTWTVPSLNIQLQKTLAVGKVIFTPYTVSGTALLGGNIAAYVGGGAAVTVFSFTMFGNPAHLGVTADYEQWAGISPGASQKRINVGLMLSGSF